MGRIGDFFKKVTAPIASVISKKDASTVSTVASVSAAVSGGGTTTSVDLPSSTLPSVTSTHYEDLSGTPVGDTTTYSGGSSGGGTRTVSSGRTPSTPQGIYQGTGIVNAQTVVQQEAIKQDLTPLQKLEASGGSGISGNKLKILQSGAVSVNGHKYIGNAIVQGTGEKQQMKFKENGLKKQENKE